MKSNSGKRALIGRKIASVIQRKMLDIVGTLPTLLAVLCTRPLACMFCFYWLAPKTFSWGCHLGYVRYFDHTGQETEMLGVYVSPRVAHSQWLTSNIKPPISPASRWNKLWGVMYTSELLWDPVGAEVSPERIHGSSPSLSWFLHFTTNFSRQRFLRQSLAHETSSQRKHLPFMNDGISFMASA